MITELRSDTFTQPSEAMLKFMFESKTGDDVFGEDPTVNQLEHEIAEWMGMESALFCPSGTMTNQIAIKCHTEPGNEVICEHQSHVYMYEGGGIAFNSGCQVRPIVGNQGRMTAAQIAQHINPDDVHKPSTTLVCIENTSNRGGGSCYEMNDLEEIAALCKKNKIALHLDGARLWNALVAKQQDPKTYGAIFDSISVCMSKGMGAPVGSLLLGKKDFIKKARRIRKVMGGGMRQAGYIAAGCLYALHHHIDRLKTDHCHAQKVAEALSKKIFVQSILPVETNIIIFEVGGDKTAAGIVQNLAEHDIKCIAISPTQIRMVFHLDVSDKMVDHLIQVIEKL